MLLRQVAPHDEDRFALVQVGAGGQRVRPSIQRVQQRRNVAGPMMIDVVGPQHLARETLQVEIFFVAGVVGADHAELGPRCVRLLELLRHRRQRFRPGNRLQLAVLAHQRRLQTLAAVHEIEGIAALDTQELAVDARPVPVVAAYDLAVADPQRGLAAVGAMRADGADVFHLPRPRLVTIRPAGERTHRADVDAHAALVA